MDFDIEKNLGIFKPVLEKRPEISSEKLKKDLENYYLPFVKKLIDLKEKKGDSEGIIVGVSAIQGAGKTTQGEIVEIMLDFLGYETVSLSIDDHYITHEQLNELREFDPRYIRRGVTHDIYLAIENLTALKQMQEGEEVKIPVYDKGVNNGDGDWVGWKKIFIKPDFIFYDGWMYIMRRHGETNVKC